MCATGSKERLQETQPSQQQHKRENGSPPQPPPQPQHKEDGGSPPPPPGGRLLSPFGVLLLSNMLETAAMALILPAYPGLCKSLGIDLKTRGWMISLYSFLQFLMSPLLGRASDVVGRTTMLRLSALASVGSYAAMLWAQDPWVFMLARVVPGLIKCGISVSQAYVSDISSPHDRAKNLGILGSMYGLAFVVGPAAGGVLMRRVDLWVTVRVALAATALNVLVLLLLPEPPRGSGSASSEKKTDGDGGAVAAGAVAAAKPTATAKAKKPSFWDLVRQSATAAPSAGAAASVAVLLARKLCTSFASGLFETTFAEYCARHLGLDGHALGLLLSYLGVLSVLNNTVIIRFLSQRFDDSQLLLPAVLGQTAALLMWSYVHDTATLLAVLAALSVSGSIFQTLLSAELSQAMPHELTGSVLGVSYALETFARILTPPLGGYLLDHRGPHSLGRASVCFLLPCLANVALEYARGRRRQREAQAARKVQ